MKIAMIVPEFPPHTIGGGGVVYNALVNQLVRQHDVRVYSACDPTRSWTRNLAPDSSSCIRRYPLLPLGATKAYFRSVVPPNLPAAVQLACDLAEWRPDVGHLHGYGYAYVDYAALVLRALKIPYVFTNHGFPVTPETRSIALRSLYRIYETVGARRTAAGAVITTYISQAVADKASRRELVRSKVIQNGLLPLPTANKSDCLWFCDKLGIADGIVIGAAGRLAWSKGFDVLIESLPHIHRRPITCVIAGADGGEHESLVRMASNVPGDIRVLLPGPLDRKGLGTLFTVADVVAVPSRDEPFGLVALEAMALGTRVVASATGGLKGFVEGPLGILVEPGDPVSMATGLDAALAAPFGTEEHTQQERILEQRSWGAVAEEYQEVLDEASRTTGQHNHGSRCGSSLPVDSVLTRELNRRRARTVRCQASVRWKAPFAAEKDC